MSKRGKAEQAKPGTGGALRVLWHRKLWWLLPLVVLFVLIGIIYALGHLSSADPEMYPTTRQIHTSHLSAC